MIDTIYAQATAPGKAGVAIVRISGPKARESVAAIGANLGPVDRKLCRISGSDGELIDIALCLSFEKGRSFTGEEVVELHLHGAPAIIDQIQTELSKLGLRHAEAGEFTRRAMENGRLDLSQVEGLADLLDAETQEQRRQAIKVFKGDMTAIVDLLRSKLIRAAALIEATIDFADEDVPVDVFPEVFALLREVSTELESQISAVAVRERIRDGFEVAIVGPPNIGKSTLLNFIAGREAAITSSIEGTTRDVIEVKMDLAGLPVTFLDTAGIREATDEIEGIGIQRGLERARVADIRVHLIEPNGIPMIKVMPEDLVFQGKGDLIENTSSDVISGTTGEGVEKLLSQISKMLSKRTKVSGIATRQRHHDAMKQALVAIDSVLDADIEISSVDLLAEDLRHSIRSLDSIIGRIDVEMLLDEIFSSFCIGK